jgi:uncharacterized DUF497 family protein
MCLDERRALYSHNLQPVDIDFEWDEANEEKLLLRHFVRADEVEQVFYNRPMVRRQGNDYVAVGQTDAGRWLKVFFERQSSNVRAYSARDLTESEKRRIVR